MEEFDVIVVGGGPAGSTAANLLAQHGRRVVLLEREQGPRYHIGESLLPYTYWVLERIGALEPMKQSAFPKKYSVQFVSASGKQSVPFYFDQHLDHPAAQTWQVFRSEFDTMLLGLARQRGAEIRMGTAARDFIVEDDRIVGVRASNGAGKPMELRAPMTIDASGRDALAINKYDWRIRDPKLNKIAVWTYYEGALRDPGKDEGATTVAYVPEKGWFWYIPLPRNVVSVGIVAERDYLYRGERDPDAIFARELENNLWIKEHVAAGRKMRPCYVTSDYTYRSRHCARDGLVLVGDAFNFLDPVFSSGVFLALKSGELAADAVHGALAAGDVSAERFTEYGDVLCRGIESMRRLVYAFYDEAFHFSEFFRKYPQMKSDVTDCLIGHLMTRDYNELFRAVTEFAALPEPLSYGRPFQRCVAGTR